MTTPSHPPVGRPTMREVAAAAGVAVKTVSRVINHVATVDPELAARVRAAADELGYRPNLTASNLRRGRTDTIGLLLEDVGNPFSAAIHRAIEDSAREAGVLIFTTSLDENPARERQFTRMLIDRGVDALILAPCDADYRPLAAEVDRGVCLVFLDREPDPLIADAVVVDNAAAARRAVEHLLDHGHRRIAYLGDDLAIQTARERLRGYSEAMAHHGVPLEDELIHHGLRTSDRARAITGELMLGPTPPTALFTSQNLITIGAVTALHRHQRHATTALVGFDDVVIGDLVEPNITVIVQNTQEIGRLAFELVRRRLAGDDSPPRVHIVPTTLVIRGSGEIAPGRA